jgi:hypothetical protein
MYLMEGQGASKCFIVCLMAKNVIFCIFIIENFFDVTVLNLELIVLGFKQRISLLLSQVAVAWQDCFVVNIRRVNQGSDNGYLYLRALKMCPSSSSNLI